MLKMSIITSDNFAVLGINGVNSFFDQFGEELDALLTIDDEFINKLHQMKTYPYGFTEEYKAKFLPLFEAHKDEKVLITDDWLGDYDGKREQFLMTYVKLINSGLSSDEAKIKAREKIKEKSDVQPRGN